ncbi:hypothetical protein P4O66_001533 [Electrophorus voltai]|uniref:Uncharacterized protein n=1 Tax=Electrophorus voltai TaxID=2609070 RepID=A0AAD8Z788_9TELE|nr:hypothetical protein P4O66_001533 [Electrophorus voltai]
MLSSPRSWTPWTPTIPRRDLHSSWPHSMDLQQLAGRFLGPVYGPGSESAESYGNQLDYENRHSEVDSAGSYDPYLDDYSGYGDYGKYSDISL